MKTYLVIFIFLIAATSQAQTEPRLVLPIGHTGPIRYSTFSSNGQFVLTIGFDSSVRIWDLKTSKELVELKISSIRSAIFSPDDKYILLIDYNGSLLLYDCQSFDFIWGNHDCNSYSVRKAIFSKDSREILVEVEKGFATDESEADWDIGVIKINSTTGKLVSSLNSKSNPSYSFFLSDSGAIISMAISDSTIEVIQPENGFHPFKIHGDFRGLIYKLESPNQKFILLVDSEYNCNVYSLSSGKIAFSIQQNYDFRKAAFSPNDEILVTISNNSSARFYNLLKRELIKEVSFDNPVSDLVFSPNNKNILFSNYNSDEWISEMNLYDTEEFKPIQVLPHSYYNDPKFSFDGSLILDGDDVYYSNSGILKQKINSGSCINSHEIEFSEKNGIIYSQTWDSLTRSFEFDYLNGAYYVSNSKGHSSEENISNYHISASDDGTVTAWSSNNGQEEVLWRNKCHEGIVHAHLNEDSSKVITYGFDGFIHLLDCRNGDILQSFSGNGERIISADLISGKQILIAIGDDTTRVFSLLTGEVLHKKYGDNERIMFSKLCSSDSLVITVYRNDWIQIWNMLAGIDCYSFRGDQTVSSIDLSQDKKFVVGSGDMKTSLWSINGVKLYTRLQLKDNDWLVYDEHYRFDGTPGAIEKLYFTCGLEVIDLAQMKDSLWVPGLVEKIMSGQDILINDKPAPKLSDLNICDLTPVIEPIEQENKKILKYRITPRNGGLGNTEVYINGNLTYSLTPNQLQKIKESGKELYYLTLSTDTLQQYLTGKKNDKNPILVKSKVKGSGIYGRGEELEVAKTNDEDKPQFYGVFIGVNEYGNPQKTASDTRYRNLDYAAKDANDLALAVEKTAGNLFQSDSHIYRLTGTGNEAPTKENLQRVLAEIGEKSKASDVLYIFFAGHGDIKKGKNEEGQVQDQIRFMLMNADKANPFTTSFGVEELTKWCSPQKIKAQKRVFVFDACHSGKIIDQTMAFNGRGDDEGARIRQLDKLKDKNGMMILAAAADDESAYEDETLNQGVLTYHLLQVMKEHNDTLLVVRNWFDETIDLVKDYSKANGNKQEPSSFGDGRFEIGNVNQDVREAIKITCPKTRVGACVFVAQGQAKAQYPNVKQRVNEYFASNVRGDQLVYSKNADKAYRTEGLYLQIKDETLVTYDLYKGEVLVKSGIELTQRKYTNEDELIKAIVTSISDEIGKLRMENQNCKLAN